MFHELPILVIISQIVQIPTKKFLHSVFRRLHTRTHVLQTIQAVVFFVTHFILLNNNIQCILKHIYLQRFFVFSI